MRPFHRHVTLSAISLALFIACIPATYAEHTRRWRQSTYEEFLKGTAHGIAVRSDGHLELAPRFRLLADADASYLWSVRFDSKGTLYAAGGSPAKVFRFDATGKPAAIFESTELSAQALAFDAKGALYVATSPDGKVYRVSPQGEKTVFFDPKTKYIWDLAFAADGVLYVATGDKGQVFAVSPDGKSELFYETEEAHVRVIALEGRGNLIAGTEPSGRVLRIPIHPEKSAHERRAFVLYETSKRELTALLTLADGTIYASAIGEKPKPGAPSVSPPFILPSSGAGPTVITGPVVQQPGVAGAPTFAPFPPLLGSSIYRISPEGAPEELWTSRDEVVYSLGLGADGRVLAGTGNTGALLAIDGRGIFAQLAKSGSAQITGIVRAVDGKVFLCTANPGKVFSVGPEYEPEGTYESQSFDAQLFSQWGRLEWWGPPPVAPQQDGSKSAESHISFFVRSGNTQDPGREWSDWSGPYNKPGASAQAPSARFVQWKVAIHDARPGDGIEWVSLAYLPRNVAPVIDAIQLQEPGVRAQGAPVISPTPGQTPVILKMPPQPNAPSFPQPANPQRIENPPQGFAQKGYRTVVWTAHDDNDDELRFSVYFRGEAEREWKLLKDNLDQKFFSWDTTAMPDGPYYLKIVASDWPSNPPALALTSSRESERFEVGNTPPIIEDLRVGPPAGKTSIGRSASFTARGAATAIERAQYSLDGGEWTLVAPEGTISDALVQHYNLGLPPLPPGEHSLAVRAYDRYENVGSAKITFTVPASKP